MNPSYTRVLSLTNTVPAIFRGLQPRSVFAQILTYLFYILCDMSQRGDLKDMFAWRQCSKVERRCNWRKKIFKSYINWYRLGQVTSILAGIQGWVKVDLQF